MALDGRLFRVETPEFIVLVAETEDGTILRFSAKWYVSQHQSKQSGMEFHGNAGSLYLASWLHGDTQVEIGADGNNLDLVPLLRWPERSIVWSKAVAELAGAIRENRPHRAAGDHAAHLVE